MLENEKLDLGVHEAENGIHEAGGHYVKPWRKVRWVGRVGSDALESHLGRVTGVAGERVLAAELFGA